MKRLLSPRLVCLLAVAYACFVPGCSKESIKLAPVAGKVTVAGQPLTSGQVTLTAVSTDGKALGLISGNIESDGSYKIRTNNKDGAPLGKYKVTVTPSMMPSTDQKGPAVSFSRAYMDPSKTRLTIEVIDNPEPGRYDLKLSK